MSNKNKAIDILNDYNGPNSYIRSISGKLSNNKDYDLTDFQVEYILNNKDTAPKEINKTIKIADWYGKEKQSAWNTDFVPEKIRIITYFGETSYFYHCRIKYRKSDDPILCFIPKKAVLNNFLVSDYSTYEVDFDRYDNLSMAKDVNRKLLPHQKEAVKFLLSRKKCILADDQGLGKTTELSVAAIEGNFDSIVIICPASLKTNWKKELSWYVNEEDITIVESLNDKSKPELEAFLGYAEGKSGKKKEELLEEAKLNGKWQNNRFVIVNYDILDEFYKAPKTRSKANIDESIEKSPLLKYIHKRKSLLIIDEAHKLSNSTSNRYKVVSNLIKYGEPHSIYLATGTPVTNNPQNLYCLLKFLDDPIKDDYTYYMDRYCGAKRVCAPQDKDKRNAISKRYVSEHGKRNWYELTDDEKMELDKIIARNCRMIIIADSSTNLEELRDRISHIYLRREKTDLGTLPNKYIHEVYYHLTSEQKAEYDKLWEEYEQAQKELDPDKEINKELLEGAIYRKYLSNLMVDNTIKLANKILEKEDKLIIACCYDEELYTLKDYFGDSAVIYNGKMSLKQKDNAIDLFKNDKNIKVFIGNIIAASVGLTLICSKTLIYNNISWLATDNIQMSDRIYRIGQTKDCDIYYQLYKDTQYEYMWNVVLKKQIIADTLIRKESDK